MMLKWEQFSIVDSGLQKAKKQSNKRQQKQFDVISKWLTGQIK